MLQHAQAQQHSRYLPNMSNLDPPSTCQFLPGSYSDDTSIVSLRLRAAVVQTGMLTFGELSLPENEVVPHELQNHQRVLNVRKGDLRIRRRRRNRFVERVLGQMACTFRTPHYVVEIHRKVECQAETSGMGRG